MLGAALGAGLGVLKNVEQEKARRRANKLAATQTALSPWTKMGPGQIQQGGGISGLIGSAAQGATMGAGAQQGISQKGLGGFGQEMMKKGQGGGGFGGF